MVDSLETRAGQLAGSSNTLADGRSDSGGVVLSMGPAIPMASLDPNRSIQSLRCHHHVVMALFFQFFRRSLHLLPILIS